MSAISGVNPAARDLVPSRTPGQFNNTARYLCDAVGRDLLSRLKADPQTKPNYGWPAIYLSGHWYRRSPNLELLLFGAFGTSERVKDLWSLRDAGRKRKFGNAALLDTEFLRQAYKNNSLADRARSLEVSVSHYNLMISPYPGLGKRILAFRRRRKKRAESH